MSPEIRKLAEAAVVGEAVVAESRELYRIAANKLARDDQDARLARCLLGDAMFAVTPHAGGDVRTDVIRGMVLAVARTRGGIDYTLDGWGPIAEAVTACPS